MAASRTPEREIKDKKPPPSSQLLVLQRCPALQSVAARAGACRPPRGKRPQRHIRALVLQQMRRLPACGCFRWLAAEAAEAGTDLHEDSGALVVELNHDCIRPDCLNDVRHLPNKVSHVSNDSRFDGCQLERELRCTDHKVRKLASFGRGLKEVDWAHTPLRRSFSIHELCQ